MEELARRCLSPDSTSLILECSHDAPVVFALWTTYYESTPELVAIAFARLLKVVPSSRDYAIHCLAHSSSFLRHLSLDAQQDGIVEVLLCVWRLLRAERHVFLRSLDARRFWPFLRHDSRAVRYLALNVLSYYTEAADHRLSSQIEASVGSEPILIDVGGLGRIDLMVLEVEEERWAAQARRSIADAPVSRLDVDLALPPNVVRISDVLLPRLTTEPTVPSKIVATLTTRKNLTRFATGIATSDIILVHGPCGSGKTFLVEQVAALVGRQRDLVRIHLGDQTDAKLLLGTYVTSSTPGQFRWQEGVLTTAVRQGRWLLIEDIDKAPNDVLGLLLPLLEHKSISIPSRNEVVSAGPGFKILATKTTDVGSKWSSSRLIGGRLWHDVGIESLPTTELREVIHHRFPVLQAMSDTIMQVYEAVVEHLSGGKKNGRTIKESSSRTIGTLDLMKWCRRIAAVYRTNGIQSASQPITQAISDDVFSEAVDCFAGAASNSASKGLVVEVIGRCLAVPPERVAMYLQAHLPGYSDTGVSLRIGRAAMQKKSLPRSRRPRRPFAVTGHALRLLEQLMISCTLREPILLVGETGTGKTTIIQQLADSVGQTLVAINMSQQTESGDLLGGYKPIDSKLLAIPLLEAFESLFERTLSASKNAKFLSEIRKSFNRGHWSRFATLLRETAKIARSKLDKQRQALSIQPEQDVQPKKRRLDDDLRSSWNNFDGAVRDFELQSVRKKRSFTFAFVEGALIRALRQGHWVLLDEINLAAPDTLESINSLLQEDASIILSEKGDIEPIVPHPEFRLFSCMNPATDIGKRDLPPGVRSRFTELYVQSPDSNMQDLLAIIQNYIGGLCLEDSKACTDVAHLYMATKAMTAENRLVDGANQKPHYSIRTLSRTLTYVADIAPIYGLRRALYEAFCMSYLTLLDKESEDLLRPIIEEYTILRLKNAKSVLSQIPRRPQLGEWIQFQHYWMPRGPVEPSEDERYIMTPFVLRNMLNLVRAATTRKYPILLQGPTSSGKTSMVEHLAKRTGHHFVRINNHEHTDLQEYLGSYVSDLEGNLAFQEGILVEAVRKGHWLVLDELNLAPSDVLEALNRLLDDNRELLIPETQEVIKPHPSFVLFATQNPAGLYGGRKHLSRAFRNRFLELHFEDIPEDELETILCQRCQVAPTYCRRIVDVYKRLSLRRQSNRIFEKKNSFATLRDLFRWANRPAVGYEELAINGYLLLAERVRRPEEKLIVKEVIEQVMKVSLENLSQYDIDEMPEYRQFLALHPDSDVVWTTSMRRLFTLVALAFRNSEPVLLVGETGCGKTTVCQMIADSLSRSLRTLNAHQNTETADIIGAQRPIRDKASMEQSLIEDANHILNKIHPGGTSEPLLSNIAVALEPFKDSEGVQDLLARVARSKALFEWADGPLVQSMRDGEIFLLDEISLAEDSVLERLNSVLETGRSLVMAEKGTHDSFVIGTPEFQFCATMNPGGDFGKKELSPALRNRFTEIWVPAISESADVLQILTSTLKPDRRHLASSMLTFASFFCEEFATALNSAVVSIRDLLSWSHFCNLESLTVVESFVNGAALVYIDALGSASHGFDHDESTVLHRQRNACLSRLSVISGFDCHAVYNTKYPFQTSQSRISIGPFSVDKGTMKSEHIFHLEAPTTYLNATRVMRAMQLRKPILLEGSPGVGKTSLVAAIAALAERPLVRINFSDQTDLIDLFGSDAPVEDSETMAFAWKDAPFLRAMQSGAWVLLDEMNLAAQSILEGLNACLDHRGRAFIPELNRSFSCHPEFRIFAAQNPHSQGGGRKGLPKSFVNRFTVVYCDPLASLDIKEVCLQTIPEIPSGTVDMVVESIFAVQKQLHTDRTFGNLGAPWEFNLRDILRWLTIFRDGDEISQAQYYSNLIILQRLRSEADRKVAEKLLTRCFGNVAEPRASYARLTETSLSIGRTTLPRNKESCPHGGQYAALNGCHIEAAESLLVCVRESWPCILVGASGSGKSILVNTIGSLLGQNIHTIAMNNDMDASDLLGSFEQKDVQRLAIQVFSSVDAVLKEHMRINPLSEQSPLAIELMHRFATQVYDADLIRDTRNLLNTFGAAQYHALLLELESLSRELHDTSLGQFQWSDGSLVKAVRSGLWVVLDNANLCSPSVLDRLNSLLEPNGQLIINERIMPDGSPMLVKPHANFRLILTVDPLHGELSRAMRNRGLEIFLHMPSPVRNECMPSLRSVQGFWQDVGRSLDAGSMDAIDEESLTEAVLDYFPGSVTPRVIKHLSEWQTQALDNALSLFRSDSFKTLRNFDTNRLLCSSLDPVAVSDARFMNAADGSSDHSLDMAILREKLGELWLPNSFSSSETITKRNASESRLLYDIGTTLLQASGAYIRSTNPAHVTTVRNLVLILYFFVREHPHCSPEVMVTMFRKLKRSIDDADPNLSHELGLIAFINRSSYLRPMTSGFLMEHLWKYLRPSVAANKRTLDQSHFIEQLLSTLDLAVRSKSITFQEAQSLQIRYLRTLLAIVDPTRSELSQLVNIDEINSPSIVQGSRPVSAPVHQPLFDFALKKLQYALLSTFHNWGAQDAPLMTDLFHLNTLAHRDTLDLLHYISSDSTNRKNLLARFSSLMAATFSSKSLHVEGVKNILNCEGFVNEWYRLLRATNFTQLCDLQTTVKSIREVGVLVTQHSASILEDTPKSMTLMILTKLRMILHLIASSTQTSLGVTVDEAWHQHEEQIRSSSIQDQCSELRNLFGEIKNEWPFDIRIPLSTCIDHLSVADRTSDINSSTRYLGTAWIYLAKTFLHMFVPDIPLDPSMSSSFDSQYCNWRLQRSSRRHAAQLAVHMCFTGGSESPRIADLATRVQDEVRTSSMLAHDKVYRPETSALAHLQSEYDYCISAISEGGPITNLVSLFQSGNSIASAQASTFLNSWGVFEARLRSYEGYRDVLSPMLEAAGQIRTGFELLLSCEQQLESHLEEPSMLVSLLHNPLQIVRLTGKVEDTSLKSISAVAAKQSFIWNGAMLRIALFGQEVFGKSSRALEVLQMLSQCVFQQWFVQRQEQQERDKEDTSLFKYAAPPETTGLEDYRDLFPDYEMQQTQNQPVGNQAFECLFFEMHTKLLLDSEHPKESQSRDLLVSLLDELIVLVGPQVSDDPSHEATPAVLATALYTANRSLHLLGQASREKEVYDFYRDPNTQETSQLVPLLERLRVKINQFVEDWPENSTLLEIDEALGRMLGSPITTPLAQILTMVEQLFTLLAQWQEVASREYSIEEIFELVRSQIVTWRRFELSCWPHLFDLEEKLVARADSKIWYNLYEVVIFASIKQGLDISEDFLMETITTLIQFMRSSSVGQFSGRLQYLCAFSKHVQLISCTQQALQDLVQPIALLTSYFQKFELPVSQHLSKERKVLSREITEVIKLASWKDTNVFALRESARRSHRTLYKIIHKFRRILNLSVQGILDCGFPDTSVARAPQRSLSAATISFVLNGPGPSPSRHARFVQVERTAHRVSLVAEYMHPMATNHLKLFVDEAIESMNALRADTPTVFDKAQVPLVKHLKNRKHKLLSDSYKALKSLGLRSVIKPEDLLRQKTVEALFLTCEADKAHQLTTAADHYFFRIVDVLPNIRAGYASHSDDIDASDIKRGTGYFDSLLWHMLRERSAAIEFSAQKAELENLFSKYQSLTFEANVEREELILQSERKTTIHSFEDATLKARTLQQLLALTEAYFAAHHKSSEVSSLELSASQWWSALVQKSSKMHREIEVCGCPIFPTRRLSFTVQAFEEHLLSVIADVQSHIVQHPNESYIFTPLMDWLSSLSSSSDKASDEADSEMMKALDEGNIEHHLQIVSNGALLATQRIQARIEQVNSVSETDLWFTKSSNERCKSLKAASLGSVISDLSKTISILESSCSDGQSMRLQNICTNYAPILQAFLGLCHVLQTDFAMFHESTAKCTLLVGNTLNTLARDGFCSPKPSDPTPGESKATSDGTGLGQGEGVEDITKDIEDDEDLGDLDGIDDKEKDDLAEDKAEAKEMDDDVAGDLEDVEPSDDENDQLSDNDQEEEEIEDEIGNVDDQDDTALDEKLWDEEHDESREKDTQKNERTASEDQGDVDLVNKEDGDAPAEEPKAEDDKPDTHPETEDMQEEKGDDEKDSVDESDDREVPENNMDEAQNLDLPEDLNMDSDLENDEQDAESQEDAGEQQNLSAEESEAEEVNNEVEEGEEEENEENGEEKPDGDEPDGDLDHEMEQELETEPVSEDVQESAPDDLDRTTEEQGPDIGGVEANSTNPGDRDDKDASMEHDEEEGQQDVEMDPAENQGNSSAGADGRSLGDTTEGPTQDGSEDLRSLGEALEKFRRMLHISDATPPSKNEEPTRDNVSETDMADQFEHVDENQDADTQAMGPNADDVTKVTNDPNQTLPELEENMPEASPAELDDDAVMREDIPDRPNEQGLETDPSDRGSKERRESKETIEGTGEDDEISDASDEERMDVQPISRIEPVSASHLLWREHEQRTRDLANGLCEQLRLILEPTMATKMRGDYRTGKRLNMRRIIPYIASQFKKDKIWMRRSKPSKRQYQVMLAIDDSKSMAESSSIQLSFDTVALVSKALSVLEVGQISVVKFGAAPETVHGFQDAFSSEAGSKIFESFHFDQTKTNVKALAARSLDMFRDARAAQHSSGAELWQLQLIISDGICEDHDSIRRILRQAHEERVLVIFVVIDTIHGAKKHSILQMSQVKYVTVDGTKKLQVQQYMEDFPFENFLIIKDVAELPQLLCSTLRQFFAASQ